MRWELLERFLSDRCNPAERAAVERWLAESPRRRQVLDQLTDFIALGYNSASAELEWLRLKRDLEMEPDNDHPGSGGNAPD